MQKQPRLRSTYRLSSVNINTCTRARSHPLNAPDNHALYITCMPKGCDRAAGGPRRNSPQLI